jgi:hypothetical protein
LKEVREYLKLAMMAKYIYCVGSPLSYCEI